MTTAIILAAGRGSRMGGPKARLVVGGVPLVTRHCTALKEAGVTRIVIGVRGENADAVRWAARTSGIAETRIVDTTEPAATLASCMELIGAEPSVVITPVDALPPQPTTTRQLLAAVEVGALAATPSYKDRGGHPVVCRREILDVYRKDVRPLREVLDALGERRVRIAVDDPAIRVTLEGPPDVLAHFGELPEFL